jgi:hypothetical protein
VAPPGELGELQMPLVLGVEEGNGVGQHLEGAAADVPLTPALSSAEGAFRLEGLDDSIDAGGVQEGRQVVGFVGVTRFIPIKSMTHNEPLCGEPMHSEGERGLDDGGGQIGPSWCRPP